MRFIHVELLCLIFYFTEYDVHTQQLEQMSQLALV